ncbi:MAG TPA: hypothetical protein VF838_11580 [Trebonia sp.]
MTVTNNAGNRGAYDAQLAGRAAELLPGIGTAERLELLGLMDPDDIRTSLAWLAAAHPEIFDHSLVRDRALVGRLEERRDEAYEDEDDLQPYCKECSSTIGIFIGHGDAWLAGATQHGPQDPGVARRGDRSRGVRNPARVRAHSRARPVVGVALRRHGRHATARP